VTKFDVQPTSSARPDQSPSGRPDRG